MKAAVIGAGAMGKWFAKFFASRGWSTKISDINEKKAKRVAEELKIEVSPNNKEAVEEADIVLISVPIDETQKIIEEISDYTKKDAIIIDIASVKENIVKYMKKLDYKIEMVSIHPLFGPGAKDLKEKDIISIPVRTGDKYPILKEILSDQGANIIEMSAEEHDKLMAIIQSLTHYTLLSYSMALTSMEQFEKVEALQTPSFDNLFNLSKAFLRENPKIFADIQKENKYSADAREALKKAVQSLDTAFESEDIKKIEKIFEKTKSKIGSKNIEEAYKKLYKN